MKNLFKLAIVGTLILLSLVSCKKDEEESVNTYAKITVLKSGQSQAGVTVYMFDDHEGPNTSFFEPLFAEKSVVTESNGVATFLLLPTFDLNVIDPQTTLYYGVFDENDNVLGSAAITIQEGQTKSATITY